MRFGRVLSPSRLSCAGMAARRSLRSGAGPSDAESRCGEPRPSPRPGEGGVNSHRRHRWCHRTPRPHRTPRIRKARVTTHKGLHPLGACRAHLAAARLSSWPDAPAACASQRLRPVTARARRGSLQPPLRGRGRRRSEATGARPSPRSKRRNGSARSRPMRPPPTCRDIPRPHDTPPTPRTVHPKRSQLRSLSSSAGTTTAFTWQVPVVTRTPEALKF